MNKFKSVWDDFTKYPFLLYLPLLAIVLLILYLFDCKVSIGAKDVLVEAHGLIFDLIVFGILLSTYEFLRNKRDKIERHEIEIDAFRNWHEKESSFRIIQAVKELNKIGVSRANLNRCHFEHIQMEGLDLEGAYLEDANFSSTSLSKVIFKRADLENAKFNGANILQSDFSGANSQNANFSYAQISWVDFRNCTLGGIDFTDSSKMRLIQVDPITKKPLKEFPASANFENAILSRVDFRGCNLYGVNFKNVKFNEVKVDSATWFDDIIKINAQGLENINDTYYIDPEEHKDSSGKRFFWIKAKKQ